MQRTIEWLTTRKAELAERLETELRTEFNLQGLFVGHGITKNEDQQLDFAFNLQAKKAPPKAVADAARQKLAAWEPDSKPSIRCMEFARAL